MINEPSVSVITLAYNAGCYLEEAIESILVQSFKDFEYIIIDDGSTDNTYDIIERYSHLDSRIMVFQNAVNIGLFRSRNLGVSLSRGQFIAWQDADDISLPHRIEHQYEYLLHHPRVGMVGGFLEFFGEGFRSSIRKYAPDDLTLRRKLFRYSPVAEPAAMIRKRALEDAGKYNTEYPAGADLDMSFRIGINFEFANLQEVVLRYRQTPTSVTFTQLNKMEKSTFKIRQVYSRHNSIYTVSLIDKIYNWIQILSSYFLPTRIRIATFNFFRNSRV